MRPYIYTITLTQWTKRTLLLNCPHFYELPSNEPPQYNTKNQGHQCSQHHYSRSSSFIRQTVSDQQAWLGAELEAGKTETMMTWRPFRKAGNRRRGACYRDRGCTWAAPPAEVVGGGCTWWRVGRRKQWVCRPSCFGQAAKLGPSAGSLCSTSCLFGHFLCLSFRSCLYPLTAMVTPHVEG